MSTHRRVVLLDLYGLVYTSVACVCEGVSVLYVYTVAASTSPSTMCRVHKAIHVCACLARQQHHTTRAVYGRPGLWAGLGLKTENNVQTSSYVARHYRSRARGVALGCDLRTCVGAWGQLYWVYTLSKGTCTSPADSCTCECSWLQRAAAVDPIRGASVSTAASACCRSR